MAIEAGTRIGPFLIHEGLGQGDLGIVFRALDGRDAVAIKILDRIAVRNPWDRLAELTQRLAGLRHPNLAAILEIGEHEGTPYVVEQYGTGGSLADHLRRACLSEPAALWVLRAVADGIDHAHQVGFVHGALNPHQIVLDTDDKPFVTDFGLAALRWPHPKGGVLVTDRNAGYAAPEVVLGCRPMPASDRYSFAAMAYQLLAGHPTLVDGPPDPSTLDRELSPRVRAVLRRGLAEDHSARWDDCMCMVQALADAISSVEPEPMSIPGGMAPVVLDYEPELAIATGDVPEPATPPSGRARERPWARWTFMAAAAVVLAGQAAASWLAGSPPGVRLTVSSPVAVVGDVVVVAATNLPPGQVGIVQLQTDPEQVGIFRADRSGAVRTEVTIPQDASPGGHWLSLCWDGGCHGRVPLTITATQASLGTGAGTGLGPGAAAPFRRQPL